MNNINFITYQKNYNIEKSQYVDGQEELVYVGKISGKKDQIARIVVAFAPVNGQQKIVNFAVNVLTLQKEAPAKK